MKISVKFLALLLSTIFILSAAGTGLTLSASETPSVSVEFDKTWFYVGETYTPNVEKSSDDLTIVWSIKTFSPAVASVSSNGTVTALSVGFTMVTAYCQDADYTQSFNVYVYDSLGIESNLSYYIMNVESQRLMSSASTNSSDYANVVTSPRSWEARSRWKVIKQSDGSFKIYGFSGVPGTVLKSFGTNAELETDEFGNAEKFRLIRVDQGDKKGLYLIKNSNGYVTQNSATSGYNVYLADEPNDFSYWSFMKVEKGYAEFFGFDYEGFNTSFDDYWYNEMALEYGYEICGHVNSQPERFKDELCLEDLMMYSGHGNAGVLAFKDSDGIYGEIAAHRNIYSSSLSPTYPIYYISDYAYNELSSMRCVMYMSCNSGNKNGYSLLDETYKKGAHFVFGITVSIETHDCSEWTDYFWQAIDAGQNIQSAIESATVSTGEVYYSVGTNSDGSTIWESRKRMPVEFVGDSFQYINIS